MNERKGGEIMDMNDMLKHGIPIEAINKGRAYGDVLDEYRRIWEDAKEVATTSGKDQDEIFTDTMMVAAYRIYLLGVEDGMKEVSK